MTIYAEDFYDEPTKDYDKALNELGNHIGTEIWHNYMGGAMSIRCEDESGVVLCLSIIYDKDIEEVRKSLRKISGEKFEKLKINK